MMNAIAVDGLALVREVLVDGIPSIMIYWHMTWTMSGKSNYWGSTEN